MKYRLRTILYEFCDGDSGSGFKTNSLHLLRCSATEESTGLIYYGECHNLVIVAVVELVVVVSAIHKRDGTVAVLGEVYEVVLPVPPEPFLNQGHAFHRLALAVFPKQVERIRCREEYRNGWIAVLATTEVDQGVVIVHAVREHAARLVAIEGVLVVPFDPSFGETWKESNN